MKELGVRLVFELGGYNREANGNENAVRHALASNCRKKPFIDSRVANARINGIALLLLIIGFSGLNTQAKDIAVDLNQVPKIINDAVLAAFPQAKILSAGQRSKDGKVQNFNVKVQNEGDTFDVYLDTAGVISSTAVQVAKKQIPDLIHDTALRIFPKSKITEGRRVTDFKTKKISYCVDASHGRKIIEFNVEPTGKLISQETIEE